MGIEPVTSSLPRKRSTPELRRLGKRPLGSSISSGRRGSNPRPAAWKAAALPTELLPLYSLQGSQLAGQTTISLIEVGALEVPWWGEQDSNLRRLSQQIYSLPRLTASVSPPTISYLKNSQNIQSLNQTPDFKGMQNYTLFSFIQTNSLKLYLFFAARAKARFRTCIWPFQWLHCCVKMMRVLSSMDNGLPKKQ
jgi:hypothetical protein